MKVMKVNKDALEEVKKSLLDGGFDGLYSKDEDWNCCCHIEDMLFCSSFDALNCKPGYLCNCKHDCSTYDYCILKTKKNGCWQWQKRQLPTAKAGWLVR